MNLRTKESVEKLNQIRQEKIYRELMTGETTVKFEDAIENDMVQHGSTASGNTWSALSITAFGR